MEYLLKYLAIFSIQGYQLFGRRFFRRTCLFRPSCSRRAISYFSRYGFKKGLQLTRQQLAECRGNYSLRINKYGAVELITGAGKVVSEPDINPEIAERIRMFWGTLPEAPVSADEAFDQQQYELL